LTNYFNKLYLYNVISYYNNLVENEENGQKNWKQQADKLIKPFISKYASIPTKLKDTTIRNEQMKKHANETASNLFKKLIQHYDRKK
jgi:hypothetical protein